MSVEARPGLLRRRLAVVGGGGGARGGLPSARGVVELHLVVLDGGVGIVVEVVLRCALLAGEEHSQLVCGPEGAPESAEEEEGEKGTAGVALCFFSGGELPESVEEEEEGAAARRFVG